MRTGGSKGPPINPLNRVRVDESGERMQFPVTQGAGDLLGLLGTARDFPQSFSGEARDGSWKPTEVK
jgi:hypothetical protein